MEKYSPRERVEMILAGEKPDRFAASFWRHFYHMEHHAEGTAEAMVWFQKKFQWDFVKINPRADYHVEDWGVKLRWSHDEFTKHTKLSFPVTTVDDWAKIRPLPLTSPVLAEHLKLISLIRKALGNEVPILMTVFTPLSIAGRLVPQRELLVEHLRQHPEKVLPALEAITDTFAAFALETRNAGADGIFFATTEWASAEMLDWEEYLHFGVPFDVRVVKATEGDALNLFHICSTRNFLPRLAKTNYYSRLYNWDSEDPTNPSLEQGYELLPGKVLVGGIDEKGWLLKAETEEIPHKIRQITSVHDPARLILGPCCAVPPEVPLEHLQAIRESLR